jgi:hypothetical protein
MFFALRREGDRNLVAPLSIESPIKLGFWGEGRSGNRRIQSKKRRRHVPKLPMLREDHRSNP